MRMTPEHLLCNRLDHAAEIGRVRAPRRCGREKQLEEADRLAPQIVHIAARNGVGYLVGFLDCEGNDRLKSLLEVLCAATPLTAQGRHDRNEPIGIARRLHQHEPQAKRQRIIAISLLFQRADYQPV
jgi:hypothetical protein